MRRLCAGKAFFGAPELSLDAGAATSTSFLGTADEAEGGAPFGEEEVRRWARPGQQGIKGAYSMRWRHSRWWRPLFTSG